MGYQLYPIVIFSNIHPIFSGYFKIFVLWTIIPVKKAQYLAIHSSQKERGGMGIKKALLCARLFPLALDTP